MNTVPNAHGTFMAQAIQTCQVRAVGAGQGATPLAAAARTAGPPLFAESWTEPRLAPPAHPPPSSAGRAAGGERAQPHHRAHHRRQAHRRARRAGGGAAGAGAGHQDGAGRRGCVAGRAAQWQRLRVLGWCWLLLLHGTNGQRLCSAMRSLHRPALDLSPCAPSSQHTALAPTQPPQATSTTRRSRTCPPAPASPLPTTSWTPAACSRWQTSPPRASAASWTERRRPALRARVPAARPA